MDVWIVVIFSYYKNVSVVILIYVFICVFFLLEYLEVECWVMECVHHNYYMYYMYCQIIFQNVRVPLSLYLGQHFVLSDLKKFTDLMGVNCILFCSNLHFLDC